MNSFPTSASVLRLCVAVAVAGCSGIPQQTAQITGGSEPGFGTGPLAGLVMHQKSWMSPSGKKSAALLYAPDADLGAVIVYDYKSFTKVGEATGLGGPDAACSDRNGDVYVVDYQASAISEFAYGSTTVERTLSDGLGYPIGCSVNPTNGDLAVTNFYDYSGGGSVLIYANASGTPTQIGAGYYNWPAGYDRSGNLYLESEEGNCPSGVCVEELSAGGSSFKILSFDETIGSPAAIEWDGKYLGIGDQKINGKNQFGIYESTVSGSTATSVNTVSTTDDCDGTNTDAIGWANDSKSPNDVPTKLDSEIAYGNTWCNNRFDEFGYPKGGSPKKTEELDTSIPTIVVAPRK